MKIKLQQHNKEQNKLDFKPKGKENENPLNKVPSSKQIVPIDLHKTIRLPSFLRKQSTTQLALQPYEEDIIAYLLPREKEFHLTKKHKSNILKNSKRIKVVQYYTCICTKFKLRRKTLFLATHYFDQYSQKKSFVTMTKDKMVWFAEACLFIAMKYEEIYPPTLKEWGSNIDEIVKAQSLILKELNFKLAYTTAEHYLELYFSKHQVEKSQRELYECILELFLITGHIYDHHPLSIVQNILDSFRPTLFLEEHLVEVDRSIKELIIKNEPIWEGILNQHNNNYKHK